MRLNPNSRPAASGAVLAAVLVGLILAVPPTPAAAQVTDRTAAPQDTLIIEPTDVDIFDREDADLVMTLDDVVDLALEQSFQVYRMKQQYLQSAYSLERARSNLRTQVDFRGTLPSITQGISPQLTYDQQGNPSLDYLRNGRTNMNMNIDLSQPLITNGNVTLSGGLRGSESFNELTGGRPDVENRSVQPSLGISFTQPLFQYNEIKAALRSAELTFESLDRTYTQDELQQINQITTRFYGLYQQQRSLENQAESFALSEENYITGQRKYAAGLIAEVDKMQLEVQQANDLDRLEGAINTHEQQMFSFNRLIGLPLETKVWVEYNEDFVPITVNVDQALELAFENRADIRLQEIAIEQQEMSVRQQVSNGRPNLQFNAGYDLTGNSTLSGLGIADPWNTHITESIKSDNRSPNTNVSLTLRIPIYDSGRNRSSVERSRVSLEIAERQLSETEENLKQQVINAVRSVESATRRLQIQIANLAVAEQQFSISRTRYDRGEITTTELMNAQTQYSSTQANYLGALIGYEEAKANLTEITLWDWENNRQIVRRTSPPVPGGR